MSPRTSILDALAASLIGRPTLYVATIAAVWLVGAVATIAVITRQQRAPRRPRHRAEALISAALDDVAPERHARERRARPTAAAPRIVPTPPGTPPALILDGPPTTRGTLPFAGDTPLIRHVSCTTCHDEGFLAGCHACGAGAVPHEEARR